MSQDEQGREYAAHYAYIGTHPQVIGGRALGPSQTIPGTDLGPEDDWLIDEGRLIPSVEGEAAELSGDELLERARELDVQGRSKMSADELRAAIAAAENGGDS